MFQVIFKAVLGELALDAVARTACSCAVWISTLDHESRNDSVEDDSIIISLVDQGDKIVYSVWRDFRIKLCFHDIAIFHFNGNDRVLCHDRILLIIVKKLFCSILTEMSVLFNG